MSLRQIFQNFNAQNMTILLQQRHMFLVCKFQLLYLYVGTSLNCTLTSVIKQTLMSSVIGLICSDKDNDKPTHVIILISCALQEILAASFQPWQRQLVMWYFIRFQVCFREHLCLYFPVRFKWNWKFQQFLWHFWSLIKARHHVTMSATLPLPLPNPPCT